jgi:hypothetical protein
MNMNWWRAVRQLVNTLVPYAALWYLMYVCVAVSYWLVRNPVVLFLMAPLYLHLIFRQPQIIHLPALG